LLFLKKVTTPNKRFRSGFAPREPFEGCALLREWFTSYGYYFHQWIENEIEVTGYKSALFDWFAFSLIRLFALAECLRDPLGAAY
jgi:hypothetical protein